MKSINYSKNEKKIKDTFGLKFQLIKLKNMKNLVVFCFMLSLQQLVAQEVPSATKKLDFKIHQKTEHTEIVKVNNENKVERTLKETDRLEHKGERAKKELHLRPHFDLKKEEKVRGSKNENLKQNRENREHSKEHRHDRKEKNKD